MAVRVLMVDDDSVHLELSERFLRRQSPDFEIVSAQTAAEAIKHLEEGNFDAAVCDIDLAEETRSGLDILEHVRRSGDEIPLIIFTGKSREEFAIQALNLGADYYLRKSESNIQGLYAELSYYILMAVEKRRTKRALKESEQKLRESEARLAEAQRISHSGSWVWDIIENKEIWSDEIYRIFGLAPQEFLATYEAFLESVHPDDRDLVRNSVDEALNKRSPYSIDHRIVRPDGSIRHVHEEGEVTSDDKGRAVRMMGIVQDITEHTNVELKKREEWWQGVFENSPAAIGIFDSEGLLIDANKAAVEMLGMKDRESLLGLDLFKESRLPERVLEGVLKRETQRFEYKWDFKYVRERNILNTSRSDVIYMDVVLSVLQGPDGQTKGYVLHVTDMTKSRRTEAALRANEEMFRTIFEESPICIELFDSNGIQVGANKASLQLFGQEDLKDAVGFDLFADPNTPQLIKEKLRRGEAARTKTRFDFSKVKKSGLYKTSKSGIMYLDAVASPLRYGKQDELHGFIVHIQNVTDTYLAEQALLESRQNYKELYNNALIGLFRARISDSMILECNDYFGKIFGFENRQGLIDGWSHFKDLLVSSKDWADLKERLKKEERIVTELQVTGRNGQHLWMRFSLHRLSKEGYIEGVMSDITQQKEAVEMLEKQREELSDFAHSMSHDLKGIFHNMMGFIELAEDEKDLKHLERLHGIIRDTGDLLDHSVMLADAGLVVEEDFTDVDLGRLVSNVASSTIPESIEYSQDALPVVKADEMKITQVFRNLFDNAVKHGKPNHIRVELTERGGMYCVAVSNDGIEIPSKYRPKLFQRGFTTSRTGKGFGLTIARRIVEAHKWNIQLRNDNRTTFELLIPKH
ncbi:MAG: hypothetical protein C4K48_02745 [Candidatus Thorarchaeota archaeon]|nr:MAG: hypothetical protein C4K48_02745 [Candidatus Thorarchaeota archaeon]